MKVLFPLLLILVMGLLPPGTAAQNFRCPPTPADADGPFYRPGAPVRSQIGSGYLLMGEVKSATNCAPIGGARIEIWMAGPDGLYDDRTTGGGLPSLPVTTVATISPATFPSSTVAGRRIST